MYANYFVYGILLLVLGTLYNFEMAIFTELKITLVFFSQNINFLVINYNFSSFVMLFSILYYK